MNIHFDFNFIDFNLIFLIKNKILQKKTLKKENYIYFEYSI
jgi:hypothetical protein